MRGKQEFFGGKEFLVKILTILEKRGRKKAAVNNAKNKTGATTTDTVKIFKNHKTG